MDRIGYSDITRDRDIRNYIQGGNDVLGSLGYTEHYFSHATKVAQNAGKILKELGYEPDEIELAKIAGFMHDIGNAINRIDHAQSGAVMAFSLLQDLGMDSGRIAKIVSAIGNHDEGTGSAINAVAAALIIADKSDVRRSRVRDGADLSTDIHDRVNFAVNDAQIEVKDKKITLKMTIDTEICPVIEYFEIFLGRMLMCRKACESLESSFHLVINDTDFL